MNHDFSFDGGVESGNGGSWRGFFAMTMLIPLGGFPPQTSMAVECERSCALKGSDGVGWVCGGRQYDSGTRKGGDRRSPPLEGAIVRCHRVVWEALPQSATIRDASRPPTPSRLRPNANARPRNTRPFTASYHRRRGCTAGDTGHRCDRRRARRRRGAASRARAARRGRSPRRWRGPVRGCPRPGAAR